MKEKERDIFDEMCRSKLYDFEADTLPSDWQAIADRLPVEKKVVPFRRTLRYWAAAAVASLLVVAGGGYLFNRDNAHQPLAEKVQEETRIVEKQFAGQFQSVEPEKPTVLAHSPQDETAAVVASQPLSFAKKKRAVKPVSVAVTAFRSAVTQTAVSDSLQTSEATVDTVAPVETRSLLADATRVKKEEKKEKKIKRWSFGMGGGSVSAGTSNSLNAYPLKNTMLTDKELLQLNSPYFNSEAPKTNIRHKTPVSLGIGVSYLLNDRFSLQSGLNYTFLSSEWESGSVYHGETKQKLHFIGIPLSLSYKIAEWKRICFYAAAGAMTEVNVAGKLNSKIYIENNEIRREEKHIRMKEWLWSVNARAGASYPLLRFLSIYAEIGADYYFDNGSVIETIRSEKPFNVNLQAGFRFGF